MEKPNWYAVYTKARWEKKIYENLVKLNIVAYLPLRTVLKQYIDRKKKVEEIIIPSYIFIQISEKEMPQIRFVNGIVNFVYWLKKPAIIKDNDIEKLKEFIARDGEISFESIDKKVGDKIEIEDKKFKGQTATIVKINKNTTELILDSLQIKLILRNTEIK